MTTEQKLVNINKFNAPSFNQKYLQNKTVKHYTEYKKHRAIVRKMTRKQRRGFKIYKQLQLQERDKLKN
jgi:hypothetical protein